MYDFFPPSPPLPLRTAIARPPWMAPELSTCLRLPRDLVAAWVAALWAPLWRLVRALSAAERLPSPRVVSLASSSDATCCKGEPSGPGFVEDRAASPGAGGRRVRSAVDVKSVSPPNHHGDASTNAPPLPFVDSPLMACLHVAAECALRRLVDLAVVISSPPQPPPAPPPPPPPPPPPVPAAASAISLVEKYRTAMRESFTREGDPSQVPHPSPAATTPAPQVPSLPPSAPRYVCLAAVEFALEVAGLRPIAAATCARGAAPVASGSGAQAAGSGLCVNTGARFAESH